jgi:23S rRNA (guanosine2251-2'-O)-methyltransferase
MSDPNFIVVLPNIRSAHNVGAMLRTADGAGVDKVYITGYSPTPEHPKVAKVSLGAEHFVPWEYCRQTLRLIKKLKSAGYQIIALEQTKKSVSIYEYQPRFPLALILGNEKTGVTKNILDLCDFVIDIPMRGQKNSLNVSVAGGIALYSLTSHFKS